MPIDLGGVIRRQVRQADIWRGISAADFTNAALDVTLDVQTSYLNALRAQNNADADERVAAEIETLLSRAGPKSPLGNFLQVELANAQQTAQSSRENADNAQDGLKQLLRVPPDAHLRLTSDFRGRKQPIERGGLLERALSKRPDVQSAILRVKQAANLAIFTRSTGRLQSQCPEWVNSTHNAANSEGRVISRERRPAKSTTAL